MLRTTVALALLVSPLVAAQACAADNCLRAVKKYQATSTAFCQGYLTGATVAPSPVATYSPARLSSACSCVVAATNTASTAPAASGSASPAPKELIINGGFETGALGPWITNVGDSGYFNVADNSQSSQFFPFKARTGVKSLQFGNSGYDEHETISQSVALTAGQTYAFNAYYSVLDLPLDACNLKVTIGGAEIAQATLWASAGGGNPPRYYRLQESYKAPATATADLTIDFSCDNNSVGGVFGLDDVSLV